MLFLIFLKKQISLLALGWRQHPQSTVSTVFAFGPTQSWWSPSFALATIHWLCAFFKSMGPFARVIHMTGTVLSMS